MPRWSAHWMYYLTWLLAATHMHASTCNSSIQCSQAVDFVYSSRTVDVHRRLSNTMSTCTIMGVCTCQIRVITTHVHTARRARAKAAMLWRACSQDFTRVAVYLVVQMDLSRWKVVCCGKLTLHWTLNRWQRPSRWANHAITRQKRIDSKIYRIHFEDIVALDLCWSF